MISRYTPKGRSQRAASKTLTYIVLQHNPSYASQKAGGNVFCAYDSSSSELVACAETLEALADKCLFLGYKPQPFGKETE